MSSGERTCGICGCTDSCACITSEVPCHWINDEEDVCSACAVEHYVLQMAEVHDIFTRNRFLEKYDQVWGRDLDIAMEELIDAGDVITAIHETDGRKVGIYAGRRMTEHFPHRMSEAQCRDTIESLKEAQEAEDKEGTAYYFPCPRCGHDRMKHPMELNSMSRRFDVYICEFCGLDEAVRDSRREDPLDVHEWGMISGIENGDLDAENDEYREKREEER